MAGELPSVWPMTVCHGHRALGESNVCIGRIVRLTGTEAAVSEAGMTDGTPCPPVPQDWVDDVPRDGKLELGRQIRRWTGIYLWVCAGSA